MIYIPRQRTYIQGKEILASLFLTFTSKFNSDKTILQFEERLASYLKVKEICTVSSSREALLLTLNYYGIKVGDEIILPVHTYLGLKTIIEKCGATPVFADIDISLNISPKEIKKKVSKKTKAILLPHHYGTPCDIRKIRKAAGKTVLIIEDCAQCFGAEYEGKKTGTIGDVGIYSFSRGKNFELIGGSAITSKNSGLIKTIRDYQKSKKRKRIIFLKEIMIHLYLWISSSTPVSILTTFPFQVLSSNISKKDITAKWIGKLFHDETPIPNNKKQRFNGIQAWIGLRRLKRIDWGNNKQRNNSRTYNSLLSRTQGITLPKTTKGGISLYYPILIEDRDKIASKLIKKGVDTKRDFHKIITDTQLDRFPIAIMVSEQILSLPVHYEFTKKEISYCASVIKKSILETHPTQSR